MIATGFDVIGETTMFACIEYHLGLHKEGAKSSLERLNDVVLMQYSGLCDKNEKEIYEGDIVRDYRKYVDTMKLWVCRFNNGSYNFWNRGQQMSDVDTTQFEILGNIYENPELIRFEYTTEMKKADREARKFYNEHLPKGTK